MDSGVETIVTLFLLFSLYLYHTVQTVEKSVCQSCSSESFGFVVKSLAVTECFPEIHEIFSIGLHSYQNLKQVFL